MGGLPGCQSIADPDVEAIVPFAIDLLDIDASLEHIYQSYGGNWPITFYPYYQQGIDEKIKSPTIYPAKANNRSVKISQHYLSTPPCNTEIYY